MSRQTIVRITTADTKKTYDLPGKDIPQLWKAKLTLYSINGQGTKFLGYPEVEADIYLERQTLIDRGLVSKRSIDTPKPDPSPTTEDLIIELLEHVGVYPTE